MLTTSAARKCRRRRLFFGLTILAAARTCIHLSVVLVPRTNIAAWVQALGRLWIMCPSPRAPSLLAVWPALLFYGGCRGLHDGCRAQARRRR
ncbi:hypothetical protein C8J57DRAFT_1352298, partial [Mycena rebaudengoi]